MGTAVDSPCIKCNWVRVSSNNGTCSHCYARSLQARVADLEAENARLRSLATAWRLWAQSIPLGERHMLAHRTRVLESHEPEPAPPARGCFRHLRVECDECETMEAGLRSFTPQPEPAQTAGCGKERAFIDGEGWQYCEPGMLCPDCRGEGGE